MTEKEIRTEIAETDIAIVCLKESIELDMETEAWEIALSEMKRLIERYFYLVNDADPDPDPSTCAAGTDSE